MPGDFLLLVGRWSIRVLVEGSHLTEYKNFPLKAKHSIWRQAAPDTGCLATDEWPWSGA